jgi:DNA-binding GntR family transcriptional regulator
VTEDHSLRLKAAPLLRTRVAERIREAIATNRFPPGSRLVERELCELLGVSRTSVREALRELESEGLVSTEGARPVVATLTLAEVRAIYEVRIVLEGLAARLFARLATPEQFASLAAAARALYAAYGAYETGPLLVAKATFYEALFAGSGNAVAASMLRTIHTKISQLRATSLASRARMRASATEIRALVAALEKRDEDRAAELSATHIRNASEAAMAVYRAGLETA